MARSFVLAPNLLGGLATNFADPLDPVRYLNAIRAGATPEQALKVGDPGVGTPALGSINTTNAYGVAVPTEFLQQNFGPHPSDWRTARAEMTLNNQTVRVPFVDVGPSQKQQNKGVSTDVTYPLSQAMGGADYSKVQTKLVPNAGPDYMKDQDAWYQEQASIGKQLGDTNPPWASASPTPSAAQGAGPNYQPPGLAAGAAAPSGPQPFVPTAPAVQRGQVVGLPPVPRGELMGLAGSELPPMAFSLASGGPPPSAAGLLSTMPQWEQGTNLAPAAPAPEPVLPPVSFPSEALPENLPGMQKGGIVLPSGSAEWAAAQQAGQYAGGSTVVAPSTASELPPEAQLPSVAPSAPGGPAPAPPSMGAIAAANQQAQQYQATGGPPPAEVPAGFVAPAHEQQVPAPGAPPGHQELIAPAHEIDPAATQAAQANDEATYNKLIQLPLNDLLDRAQHPDTVDASGAGQANADVVARAVKTRAQQELAARQKYIDQNPGIANETLNNIVNGLGKAWDTAAHGKTWWNMLSGLTNQQLDVANVVNNLVGGEETADVRNYQNGLLSSAQASLKAAQARLASGESSQDQVNAAQAHLNDIQQQIQTANPLLDKIDQIRAQHPQSVYLGEMGAATAIPTTSQEDNQQIASLFHQAAPDWEATHMQRALMTGLVGLKYTQAQLDAMGDKLFGPDNWTSGARRWLGMSTAYDSPAWPVSRIANTIEHNRAVNHWIAGSPNGDLSNYKSSNAAAALPYNEGGPEDQLLAGLMLGDNTSKRADIINQFLGRKPVSVNDMAKIGMPLDPRQVQSMASIPQYALLTAIDPLLDGMADMATDAVGTIGAKGFRAGELAGKAVSPPAIIRGVQQAFGGGAMTAAKAYEIATQAAEFAKDPGGWLMHAGHQAWNWTKIAAPTKLAGWASDLLEAGTADSAADHGLVFNLASAGGRQATKSLAKALPVAAATSDNPDDFAQNLIGMGGVDLALHAPEIGIKALGAGGDPLWLGAGDRTKSLDKPVKDIQYGVNPDWDATSHEAAMNLDNRDQRSPLRKLFDWVEPPMTPRLGQWTNVKQLMRNYGQFYLAPGDMMDEATNFYRSRGANVLDNPRGFVIDKNDPANPTPGKHQVFIDPDHYDEALPHEWGHVLDRQMPSDIKMKLDPLIAKNTDMNDFTRRYSGGTNDYDSLPESAADATVSLDNPYGFSKAYMREEARAETIGKYAASAKIPDWLKAPNAMRLMRLGYLGIGERLGLPVTSEAALGNFGLKPSGLAALNVDNYIRDLAQRRLRTSRITGASAGALAPEEGAAAAAAPGPRMPGETGTEAPTPPAGLPPEETTPRPTTPELEAAKRKLIQQGQSPGQAQAAVENRPAQTLEQEKAGGQAGAAQAPTPTTPSPTEMPAGPDPEVQRRAYEIGQERQASGQPGDHMSDWLQAEKEVTGARQAQQQAEPPLAEHGPPAPRPGRPTPLAPPAPGGPPGIYYLRPPVPYAPRAIPMLRVPTYGVTPEKPTVPGAEAPAVPVRGAEPVGPVQPEQVRRAQQPVQPVTKPAQAPAAPAPDAQSVKYADQMINTAAAGEKPTLVPRWQYLGFKSRQEAINWEQARLKPAAEAAPAKAPQAAAATGAQLENSVRVKGTEFGEVDNPARGGYTEPNWNRGAWGEDISGTQNRGVALPFHVLDQFGKRGPQFANNFNAKYDIVAINEDNGKRVVTHLKDAGPGASTGAGIDLLYGTARDLGLAINGSAHIRYAILPKGSAKGIAFDAGLGTPGGEKGAAAAAAKKGAEAPEGLGGGPGGAAPGGGVIAPPMQLPPEAPAPAEEWPALSHPAQAAMMAAGGGEAAQAHYAAPAAQAYAPQAGARALSPLVEEALAAPTGYGGYAGAAALPGIAGGAGRLAAGLPSTRGMTNPEGFDEMEPLLQEGSTQSLKRAQQIHTDALSEDDERVRKQPDNGQFRGEHFLDGDPLHEKVLSNVPGNERWVMHAGQNAIFAKQPMHISYASAPQSGLEEPSPTRATREIEYDMSSPQARMLGQTRAQISGHSFIPTAVGVKLASKQNAPHEGYVQGLSTNAMVNNHRLINGALAEAGHESPYPQINDKFHNDIEGYITNLNAGHSGTGYAYAAGTKEHPNRVDRTHIPYKLSRPEADYLNAILNNRGAMEGKGAPALRELARAGGTLLTKEGETNPVRKLIDDFQGEKRARLARENPQNPLLQKQASKKWSDDTLERTIRTFKAGLVHEIHQTPGEMPENIRPGREHEGLTEGMTRRSETLHEARAPLAASFLPALSEEEHKELTGNIRKQFVSGKLRTEDYRRRMAEVPRPGEPIPPHEAEEERPEAAAGPAVGPSYLPAAAGMGKAKAPTGPIEKPANWDEQPESVRQDYLEKVVAHQIKNQYKGKDTHRLEVLRNAEGGVQYDPGGKPVYKKIDYDIANSPLLKKKALGQIAGADDHEDTIDPNQHVHLNQVERRRLSAMRSASAVSTMGNKIVDSFMGIKDQPDIMAGMGWYSKMRDKLSGALKDYFKGTNYEGRDAHELFAQLLGATSAKTPVKNNFIQALDALEQFRSGAYDHHIDKYLEAYDKLQDGGVKALVQHMRNTGVPLYDKDFNPVDNHENEGAAIANWVAHHNILPRQIPQIVKGELQKVGSKYNANSMAVLRALAGTWLKEIDAPKTPNFAGNLTGRTLEATIDVWAARHLKRLGYEGMTRGKPWRAQGKSEPGVSSLDFAFSQDAMRHAADEITRRTGQQMNPDDLQAVLWFAEKHHYEQAGWTRGAGAEKSSFDDVADLAFPKSGEPMTSADLRKHYATLQAAAAKRKARIKTAKGIAAERPHKLAAYMEKHGLTHAEVHGEPPPEEEEEEEAA